MHLPEDAVLLRIFIGESNRYQHRPLYEAIVLKARELQNGWCNGSARANGFGKVKSPAHCKNSSLVHGPPIVIKIVDSDEKVNAFLPVA